ncbi:Uncharacterised protein [uncultured archaeon]|nr:Uncharacterised protein [uncultured archaeon]
MNFIKKVFDKTPDEDVHLQFQKFSRGEFRNRAMIKAKKVKNNYTISTTSEFANEFVGLVAEKLGNEKTKVTGAIISTTDLGKEIDFQNKKQFMGIKQYVIDKEMGGNEIINLIKKFPKVFFALSFSAGGDVLKIKAKAPKSAKPKNKDEAPNPDFCKLTTSDEKIAKSFVWEKADFKLAEIGHDFFIDEIVIPDEIKNEKDFAVVREKSLRKGRIVRKAVIDGKETKEEAKFEA